MNIISENIAYYRKKKNMTQRELAEVLNISDKTVSRWETGNQIPDAMIIPELAEALSVSINELYGVETKTEKEDDNLNQTAVTIYKIALMVGVFVCVIAGWLTNRINEIPLDIKLVVYLSGVMIILISSVSFKGIYRKKENKSIYENTEIRWLGTSLIIAFFVISVWVYPFYKQYWFDIALIKNDAFNGLALILSVSLIMYFAFIRCCNKSKREGYEINKSLIKLSAVFIVFAVLCIGIFISLVSIQTLRTAEFEKTIVLSERAAGAALTLLHLINLIIIISIREKKIIKDRVIKSIITIIPAITMLVSAFTIISYNKNTLYNELSKTAISSGGKIFINHVKIGVDFGQNSFIYFELNDNENIEKLFDIFRKIKIEKTDEEFERKENVEIGEKYIIMFDNYTSSPAWTINIADSKHLFYKKDTYEIKNEVDWKELYHLTLCEYEGKNSNLYKSLVE